MVLKSPVVVSPVGFQASWASHVTISVKKFDLALSKGHLRWDIWVDDSPQF